MYLPLQLTMHKINAFENNRNCKKSVKKYVKFPKKILFKSSALAGHFFFNVRDAPDISGNFWLITFVGAFINDDFLLLS